MRTSLQILAVALATGLLLAVGAVLVAVSGWVGVAASQRHNGAVEWFLELARDRAVERSAAAVEVPELSDPGRRRRGEGLYREHCALCHGLPGEPRSPVANGLNPPPPDLSDGIPPADAAEAWWITAHGIRMSGMPTFGSHLTDGEIWDVVAWLARGEPGGRSSE
jgi:mono/diheme cytochrome c family protein